MAAPGEADKAGSRRVVPKLCACVLNLGAMHATGRDVEQGGL